MQTHKYIIVKPLAWNLLRSLHEKTSIYYCKPVLRNPFATAATNLCSSSSSYYDYDCVRDSDYGWDFDSD